MDTKSRGSLSGDARRLAANHPRAAERLLWDHATGGRVTLNGAEMTLDGAVRLKCHSERVGAEALSRVRKRAEFVTPAWMVEFMVDELFEEDGIEEDSECFIGAMVCEITCGEGPFLTLRRDPETGALAPLEGRRGVLDRKLRAASAIGSDGAAAKAFVTALQSVYGYEIAGDNLFFARVNLFLDFMEFWEARFGGAAPCVECAAASIISRNIFQMIGPDGPDPAGPEAVLFDWRAGEWIPWSGIGNEERQINWDFGV